MDSSSLHTATVSARPSPLRSSQLTLLPFSTPEAYFAPSIIQSLGYGAIRTQLLSVPPCACAFALAMLTATASDWLRMRFAFIVGTIAVSLTGFIILLTVHDNRHLQYAALFLAAMGTYSAMPIIVCWFNTNCECSSSLTAANLLTRTWTILC